MSDAFEPPVDFEAQRRWDAENAHRVMEAKGPWAGGRGWPMATWKVVNIVGKPLDDRRIQRYERAGWYSAEFKRAREKAMLRAKVAKDGVRRGNFREVGGRMIYSP